ncbi:MAG: hypothetical protein M1834_009684 [Cirrosporium novae-zelandiae]|nr:MAG: hypothetical protein M1834_009684 [Cirrosporium novae-zelandiae]
MPSYLISFPMQGGCTGPTRVHQLGLLGQMLATELLNLANLTTTGSNAIVDVAAELSLASNIIQQLNGRISAGERSSAIAHTDISGNKAPKKDVYSPMGFKIPTEDVYTPQGLTIADEHIDLCVRIFNEMLMNYNNAESQLHINAGVPGERVYLYGKERKRWPFQQPRIDELRKDLVVSRIVLMLLLRLTELNERNQEHNSKPSKSFEEQRHQNEGRLMKRQIFMLWQKSDLDSEIKERLQEEEDDDSSQGSDGESVKSDKASDVSTAVGEGVAITKSDVESLAESAADASERANKGIEVVDLNVKDPETPVVRSEPHALGTTPNSSPSCFSKIMNLFRWRKNKKSPVQTTIPISLQPFTLSPEEKLEMHTVKLISCPYQYGPPPFGRNFCPRGGVFKGPINVMGYEATCAPFSSSQIQGWLSSRGLNVQDTESTMVQYRGLSTDEQHAIKSLILDRHKNQAMDLISISCEGSGQENMETSESGRTITIVIKLGQWQPWTGSPVRCLPPPPPPPPPPIIRSRNAARARNFIVGGYDDNEDGYSINSSDCGLDIDENKLEEVVQELMGKYLRVKREEPPTQP